MKQRRHTPEQVIRKLAEGEKLLAEGKCKSRLKTAGRFQGVRATPWSVGNASLP